MAPRVLMAAAFGGHLEVVRALVAAKADVNAKAANGTTALIIASQNGHPEWCGPCSTHQRWRCSRPRNQPRRSQSRLRRTRRIQDLINASRAGDLSRVKALLAAGADVNAKWDPMGPRR